MLPELVTDEDFGWYVVAVPVGEELAKCLAYSMHPEVLIAEPNFLGTVDDPTPAPAMLPSGGGTPDASRIPNAFYIIAGAALLVVSAAVVISQRAGHNKT